MVRAGRADACAVGHAGSSRNPNPGVARRTRVHRRLLVVQRRREGILRRPDHPIRGADGADGVGRGAEVGRPGQPGLRGHGAPDAPQEEAQGRRGLPGRAVVRPLHVGPGVAGARHGAPD